MQDRHRLTLAGRSRWQQSAAAVARLGHALFGNLVSGFAAAAVALHPELMLSSTEWRKDEALPDPDPVRKDQSPARGG
ncbi:hypothetical protein [Geminicoccus harenae]|uniref:hypothetical protein n=1 Tax=Geminicoccus harenae TaxID=2498453 RepID=UPI001C96F4BD|nr:hypothetical protein [Geminicoccus harenae]